MSNQTDQRQSFRHETNAICMIRDKKNPDKILSAQIIDVSSNGMKAVCSGSITEQSVVTIETPYVEAEPVEARVIANQGQVGDKTSIGFQLTQGGWPFQVFSYLCSQVESHDPYLEECFRMLGLNINAAENDIHSAYQQKLKLHHPDRGGDQEQFIQLRRAYLQALNYHGLKP